MKLGSASFYNAKAIATKIISDEIKNGKKYNGSIEHNACKHLDVSKSMLNKITSKISSFDGTKYSKSYVMNGNLEQNYFSKSNNKFSGKVSYEVSKYLASNNDIYDLSYINESIYLNSKIVNLLGDYKIAGYQEAKDYIAAYQDVLDYVDDFDKEISTICGVSRELAGYAQKVSSTIGDNSDAQKDIADRATMIAETANIDVKKAIKFEAKEKIYTMGKDIALAAKKLAIADKEGVRIDSSSVITGLDVVARELAAVAKDEANIEDVTSLYAAKIALIIDSMFSKDFDIEVTHAINKVDKLITDVSVSTLASRVDLLKIIFNSDYQDTKNIQTPLIRAIRELFISKVKEVKDFFDSNKDDETKYDFQDNLASRKIYEGCSISKDLFTKPENKFAKIIQDVNICVDSCSGIDEVAGCIKFYTDSSDL